MFPPFSKSVTGTSGTRHKARAKNKRNFFPIELNCEFCGNTKQLTSKVETEKT